MDREDLMTIIRQLTRYHNFDEQDLITIFIHHTTIDEDDLEAVIKAMIEGK